MNATPEQIEALDAKVKGIGSLLGFTYDPTKEDNQSWNYSRVLVNGEARIILSINSYELGDMSKAAFHVSGVYPRDRKGQLHTHYQETLPTMNSSCKKIAAQIAADIKRRFLPDYLKMFAELKQRAEKSDTYVEHQADNLKMIAQALGVKGPRDGEWKFYPPLSALHSSIQNYGDDKVKFEVLCKPETAIEVIRIIQAMEPQEGG